MKKIQVKQIIALPIIVGLMISMGINGFFLVQGKAEIVNLFMNFYNGRPVSEFPSYTTMVLILSGALQLFGLFLLITSLIKREFLPENRATFLKWGTLMGAFSWSLYGFVLRMISNHSGAANLFFFLGMIYLFLWFVEKREKVEVRNSIFDHIKLLPIIFTMTYTMGQPGYNKLFQTADVMGFYVTMFQDSFLAKLPGGIPPFIYLLGILEIAVPILLLIGLVRCEFIASRPKTFLGWGMIVGISTFIMLSFGMSILLNFPGATNLVFYAIVSLGFWLYTNQGIQESSR